MREDGTAMIELVVIDALSTEGQLEEETNKDSYKTTHLISFLAQSAGAKLTASAKLKP